MIVYRYLDRVSALKAAFSKVIERQKVDRLRYKMRKRVRKYGTGYFYNCKQMWE